MPRGVAVPSHKKTAARQRFSVSYRIRRPRGTVNRSGAEGGRTLYLCIANAALSQMSYGPMNSLGALLTGSSDGQSVTVIDDRGTDSLSGILVGARKSV